jgi:pimeloyl-ACP methyl ester carboxylesterase
MMLKRIWAIGRKPNPPDRYLLNLVGLFMLLLLLSNIAVWSLIEIGSVIGWTIPAHSGVSIPEDLSFIPEEISFPGAGGDRMAGWYIPSRNGTTIILLHGYGGNRLSMRWHAEQLVSSGYGILMYDERASGESDGAFRSLGWQDVDDVGGALAFLDGRKDLRRTQIGILGCSTGGQIALRAAARYPVLQAVLADGPTISRAADRTPPKNVYDALSILSDWILDILVSLRTGLPLPAPVIDDIGRIAPRPIFLIGTGIGGPPYGDEEPMVRRYAEHAGSNAEVWIIPEAAHCGGRIARPEEYAQRMIGFFQRSILRSGWMYLHETPEESASFEIVTLWPIP